jgi:hypothetical protein
MNYLDESSRFSFIMSVVAANDICASKVIGPDVNADETKYIVKWLRWSSGQHAALWYPSSQIQTRPMPSDFRVKSFSACLPSEGR